MSQHHEAGRCEASQSTTLGPAAWSSPKGATSGLPSYSDLAPAPTRTTMATQTSHRRSSQNVCPLLRVRQKSRPTLGSKGPERARAQLAKARRSVANTRRHLVHQATKSLVERCQVLVIEDLNVADMTKNRHLSRSISDAAMAELTRQIPYKVIWHGVEVRSIECRLADQYRRRISL